MRTLIFLFLCVLALSTEVDNLNLLLPQLREPSFELPLQLVTAKNDCFIWTSSDNQILSVQPYQIKQKECSKQALVQLVRPGPYASTIYMTAINTATQSSLNIPVRIRKLSKIQIVTKSRMMNIKQLQKLQLFAYDSDGNTFTSIEGLRFKWTLHQKLSIIEKVALAQAQLYLPLKTRESIQNKGFQSDLLVVKALNPGNLKVYVECTQPGYENLHDQITISVHQRFQLKPGPSLYMSPASSYQLHLQRPNKEVISLPQSYYKVINCEGFQINSTLYLSVPNTLSKCQITVQDTRTAPPYQSSTTIYVQFPTELRIITETSIIVGKRQTYQIQLLHNMDILYGRSSSLRIQSNFNVDQSSSTILASLKMSGYISATLGALSNRVQIKSWLPVRAILPSSYLHLPVEQEFKLKVLGGSSSYDFSISSQIGIITNYGLLSCKRPGQANITITDRYNPLNKQIILLRISHIQNIFSLQRQKEVNKDEWSNFYIIGKSNDNEIYTQCIQSQFTLAKNDYKLEIDKKVNFTKQLRDLSQFDNTLVQRELRKTSLVNAREEIIIKTFVDYVLASEILQFQLKNYVYGLQNYGICQIIRFRSLISFFQSININVLGHDNQFTKVPLRVYEPVSTSISADQIDFLMTPQSSLTWKYNGGAYAWPSSIRKLIINGLLLKNSSEPIIQCPNTQTIPTLYELKLQNQQTESLLFPVSQTTFIKVTCKFPKKIQLDLINGDTFQKIFLNPNTPIFGQTEVVDEQGRRYHNASNVQFNYNSVSGHLNNNNRQFSYLPSSKNDKITIWTEHLFSKIKYPKILYQFSIEVVQPLKISHILFNRSLQEIQTKVTQKEEFKNLQRTIQIVTLFTPRKPYLLNFHNKYSELTISCTGQVSCIKKQNSVLVNLLTPGIGFVTIKDKRVYGCIEWTYEFTIVQVDQVIVVGSKEYIPVGNTVNATILNLYKGTIISPLLYQDNHLLLSMNPNLRVLQQNGNTFLVRAQSSGEFNIYGEQSYPKAIRSKAPLVLNVYEKIEPDSSNFKVMKYDSHIIQGQTTVVIGCRRLFRISGGPSDTTTTFTSDKGLQISKISSKTYAIAGKSQGRFNLAFIFSHRGQKINQIKMSVIVSKIESIQLRSINEPTSGSQFRIIPSFKAGEYELEGCLCQFQYKWSALNGKIVLGQWVTYGFITAGGVNATAISTGTETISLQIFDKVQKTLIAKTTKDFRILNEISYNLPTFINKESQTTKSLLIPPESSYQFPKDILIESSGCQQQILKAKMNMISALKKTGHATIKIYKEGYRPELIQVEIMQISAIFIENQLGFIPLEPQVKTIIPIYLQDNHARLFSNPLSSINLYASSSNPDVASIKLINQNRQIEITGLSAGSSVISVGLSHKNIEDRLVVTVGSQLLPAYESSVLVGGNIQFGLGTNEDKKWTSSNDQIAWINAKSGLATGIKLGRSRISNGDIFGWLQVCKIKRMEQVGSMIQRQGTFEFIYRAIIDFKQKQSELSNWDNPASSINNNFSPSCFSSSQFTATSSIIRQNESLRLKCIIKPNSIKDLVDKFSVTIKDQQGNTLSSYSYSTNVGFQIYDNKRVIKLSSTNSKEEIKIKASSLINVNLLRGDPKWVKSSYDEYTKVQIISIDMSSCNRNQQLSLQLKGNNITEVIEISYAFNPDSKQEQHSFFSYSMDFPDYLILFMTIVFIVVCLLQYQSEQKLKNS